MSKKFLVFSMFLLSVFIYWCGWNNSDENLQDIDLWGQIATNGSSVWSKDDNKISVAEELNSEQWTINENNSSEEL